ncbi:hypothetical protein D3C83_247320 [compost metagenome]
MLVLAGRSLQGTIGSNRAIGDFIDAPNVSFASTFTQKRVDKTFNDRFIGIN